MSRPVRSGKQAAENRARGSPRPMLRRAGEKGAEEEEEGEDEDEDGDGGGGEDADGVRMVRMGMRMRGG